jgi:hypothetical protein
MKRKLQTELDREMIIGQIKRLDLKKSYTVEVTEKRVRRSIPQNSLMWLWLTCIEHETGTDRNDLHDYFKERYILPTEVNIFGEKRLKYTTTDKDTKQFKEYLDKIQCFASAELSITLPNPEDKQWEEFYNYYSDKL